jgi:DNA-binding MarR family transcriptional regulator
MTEKTDAILDRYRTAILACAVMNLRQVARSVTGYFDQQLRPTGLRATQLNLLMAIETGGATTITELAEILAMDRTTMTRNLQLLRNRRLVEKSRVALTESGRKAAADALPLWEEAQGQFTSAVGEARWEALLRELARARRSISKRGPPRTRAPRKTERARPGR